MPSLSLTAFDHPVPVAPPRRERVSRGRLPKGMSGPVFNEAAPAADMERHTEDARLLKLAAAGDQSALGELYDRWVRPLNSLAFQILRDPAEAEDVLHDVFVTLWEKSSGFDPSRGNAFAWAATLTRNRSIDRLRSRARRAELLSAAAPADLGYGESGDSHSDSADFLWLKEKSAAVRRALESLPADQGEALRLAYFGGLTQQEIARKLSQPLGTVKARIRRGLLKLRDALTPQL